MRRTFRLRDREISTDLPAFIMAILNATPDSLWEGSRTASDSRNALSFGIERAMALVADGADVIDIGGESSRPGSAYVSEEEELERVIPLIEGIRRRSGIPISVDTRKASVFRSALAAGADMLNDISALRDDPALAAAAAEAKVPVVLMHMRGNPLTMQENPGYRDVLAEVASWLRDRALFAEGAGIQREKIILDPGIGFGKRQEDNAALIDGLDRIAALGYPVMMALSRKSIIGNLTGRPVEGRLAGTLAANALSVLRGATWLRVHDPAETRDILAVLGGTAFRELP